MKVITCKQVLPNLTHCPRCLGSNYTDGHIDPGLGYARITAASYLRVCHICREAHISFRGRDIMGRIERVERGEEITMSAEERQTSQRGKAAREWAMVASEQALWDACRYELPFGSMYNLCRVWARCYGLAPVEAWYRLIAAFESRNGGLFYPSPEDARAIETQLRERLGFQATGLVATLYPDDL